MKIILDSIETSIYSPTVIVGGHVTNKRDLLTFTDTAYGFNLHCSNGGPSTNSMCAV